MGGGVEGRSTRTRRKGRRSRGGSGVSRDRESSGRDARGARNETTTFDGHECYRTRTPFDDDDVFKRGYCEGEVSASPRLALSPGFRPP